MLFRCASFGEQERGGYFSAAKGTACTQVKIPEERSQDIRVRQGSDAGSGLHLGLSQLFPVGRFDEFGGIPAK